LSINDIRAKENLPPVPGGDVYQETPVGGEANQQPGHEDTSHEDDDIGDTPANPDEE
jgi:hypothetical protein